MYRFQMANWQCRTPETKRPGTQQQTIAWIRVKWQHKTTNNLWHALEHGRTSQTLIYGTSLLIRQGKDRGRGHHVSSHDISLLTISSDQTDRAMGVGGSEEKTQPTSWIVGQPSLLDDSYITSMYVWTVGMSSPGNLWGASGWNSILMNGHFITCAALHSSWPSPIAQKWTFGPSKRSLIHLKHCSFPTSHEL